MASNHGVAPAINTPSNPRDSKLIGSSPMSDGHTFSQVYPNFTAQDREGAPPDARPVGDRARTPPLGPLCQDRAASQETGWTVDNESATAMSVQQQGPNRQDPGISPRSINQVPNTVSKNDTAQRQARGS
jgi:hypothetical protein